MRSHPAQHGEGFDAPPTLERSGSERRGGAVSSLSPEGERVGVRGGAFLKGKEGRVGFRKKSPKYFLEKILFYANIQQRYEYHQENRKQLVFLSNLAFCCHL